MAPVRRKLDFGGTDTSDCPAAFDKFLDLELRASCAEAKLFWNFDFVEGKPVSNGRFEWVPVTDDEVPAAYNAAHPGKNTILSAIEGLNIVDGNKAQRTVGIVPRRKKLTQRLISSMLAIKKSVSSKTKNAGRDSLQKLRKAIVKTDSNLPNSSTSLTATSQGRCSSISA